MYSLVVPEPNKWEASPEPAKPVQLIVAAQLSLDQSVQSELIMVLFIAQKAEIAPEVAEVYAATFPAIAGAPSSESGPPAYNITMKALLPAGWHYMVESNVREGKGIGTIESVSYQTLA